METIFDKRRQKQTKQKPDRISGDISTFSRIPRSTNNPGSKAKSERNNQSIPEGPAVFEGEYIYYFSRINNLVRIDLTAFSASTFSNSSTSSKLQAIIQKTFLDYNFFCFRKRTTFLPKELH